MDLDQKNIRNFAIIAHIDHGKSTLADRMLEETHTIEKDKMREQFLDQNPISRERGITIKLAPVRMNYTLPFDSAQGENAIPYVLNLIDTPGHVDFSYEVSRTLACCEGAVLLVDATQGIQAQTVAHFMAARRENLKIIPVINKIDLPSAQIERTIKQMTELFSISKEDILFISAKTGQGVISLIRAIIEKLPPPSGSSDSGLRALIFDAHYSQHKGVIAYAKIVDGSIKTGDKIELFQTKIKTTVIEIGYFTPYPVKTDKLKTGEIGYIVTGVKNIKECKVGDTITESQKSKVPTSLKLRGASKSQKSEFEPLPGYKVPKPMIFLDIYPRNQNDYIHLKQAIEKLSLNDSSLTFSEEYSAFLGSGLRVGFLGLLHAQVVRERLVKEENIDPLLTSPQVSYKNENGILKEPYIALTIYAPQDYVGKLMSLCQNKKGNIINLIYYDTYAVLEYEMPYSMLIKGLTSEIKSLSSGFASIDYEITGYKPADLVKLEILINQEPIDILTEIVYRDEEVTEARKKAEKLKEVLPKQQYKQIIQAVSEGKILARSEISPFRKDVLAKMSGGDRSRKDKLLESQKKGKKKLRSIANISIPQEALFSLVENS
ncbi:MAG: GTP-binding protein [Patescibacteria group bacterium]|nr:GTP-binding protein [Patescibacteria group bacterium]